MTDKQIEQAANEYASEHLIEDAIIVAERPWPDARQISARAFQAGARWALSAQWISFKDALPQDGDTNEKGGGRIRPL